MAKQKLIIPQSKTKQNKHNRDVVDKRKCLGVRYDSDCNREFRPPNRFTFLCDLCRAYISRANLDND